MKYKRQKKVKSILKMFNFLGFEPPYTVVMDGTFSMAALNNKVNLAEQIPIYLGLSDPSAVKLCTTKCVLKELEKLGSYFYGALHILKQYPPIKCAHSSKKLKSAALCLQRLAESGFKCVLASQDSVSFGYATNMLIRICSIRNTLLRKSFVVSARAVLFNFNSNA